MSLGRKKTKTEKVALPVGAVTVDFIDSFVFYEREAVSEQ